MEILLNAAFPMMPNPFPKFSTPKWRPMMPHLRHCLGKNGESIGLSRGPNQIELEGEDSLSELQYMNTQPEKTHTDIWRLFKEAQQNILYLNKQRMKALEELDEMKREKVNKHASTSKEKLSIRSELLLRIDSMVLTGMINTQEASDLRKLIIDSKASLVDDLSDILHQGDAELLAGFRCFFGKRKMKSFHIVHICTEMAPVTSVGSLASYITGLSCALQRKGNFVEVILPKYSSLNLDEVKGLREIETEFYSYFNGQLHANVIWTGVVCGIGVTFIQPVYYSSFFCREMMYGYSDDFERFAYFSRASLDYIVKSGKQPDVLHIHNWETSIVGPLFWDVFVNQGLSATRILLTCQAFNSQRLEHPDKLALCGLDPSRLNRPDRLQDHNKTHFINILKGGVVYSNKVMIMSSMHSKGHIIRNLSHGLEPTLAVHKDKLMVAPFGFDNSTWDPSKDKLLPQSYSTDDLRGKDVCKVALQQHLGLRDHTSIVLVGCIFSEVSDVDVDSLEKLIWIASRRGAQFIIMGISKIPGINRALESFQGELKDENVRFLNEYDEALSHLVFAGSDIILCPSFDDPVSQLPLKALRYGAAPIAMNFTDYTFRQFMDHDFESTKLSRYISTFANVSLSQQIDEIQSNPSEWKRKIIDVMAKDLSWDAECCDIHLSAYTSINKLVK